jgi:hypothetical protein
MAKKKESKRGFVPAGAKLVATVHPSDAPILPVKVKSRKLGRVHPGRTMDVSRNNLGFRDQATASEGALTAVDAAEKRQRKKRKVGRKK